MHAEDPALSPSGGRWGRKAGVAAGAVVRLGDFGLKISGVLLAASGAAHFVAPRPFVFISKPMFPDDTEKWVRRNGAAEAGIGLALIRKETRPIGFVGLIAYVVYLGDRAVSYIRKQVWGER
ncbi:MULTISPECIES: GNAT family protein [Tsukamurella]|uniref:hypothetical protein n=1 Tax=Tsukamurella TaxID=2060 RepID=UPI002DD443ED|nr:hypothetical protein [Tsukamurella tyrosinosolvens]MEC4616367.1 hypothetical protein [Tsukamurella tyrosinosolvens]